MLTEELIRSAAAEWRKCERGDRRVVYDADAGMTRRHGSRAGVYGEPGVGQVTSGARHAVPAGVPGPAEVRRRVVSRGSWPVLADDMFRMAHRDRDGGCLLDGRMAGFALAAALLAELVFAGRLTVEDGHVRVLDTSAPSDVVAHAVLAELDDEPSELSVRAWLAYLGDRAYEEVAGRMVRSGHVEVQVSRRLLHRRVRYVPTDMNASAWPWARLTDALRRGRKLSISDVLMGGLAVATDLHRVVLVGEASAFAAEMAPRIDIAPAALRELIAHTRAAAGDAVITKT